MLKFNKTQKSRCNKKRLFAYMPKISRNLTYNGFLPITWTLYQGNKKNGLEAKCDFITTFCEFLTSFCKKHPNAKQ